MISFSDSAHTKTWSLSAGRIGWFLLILATLYVCYFSHLGAIGFVGPDEPRYAWIAREMAESGDWITPRLYGKPWFEKPVLYYWGAALSFKFFGVNEATARLPSAVSALLATLALAWLAWRLYGAETARWLLVLLPTTVGMIGFSHAASPDMPFTGMLTIAMVAAAVLLRLVRPAEPRPDPESGRTNVALHLGNLLATILFGFFLALAVLAKGPAAIILCGGAVVLWALFTKRWRDAFRLLHPAAIVTFCLTALPWYILCAHRNPDFFRVFIIEHNFKRYFTPEFQHIQPFWFYIPVLLIGLFPWMGGAISSVIWIFRKKFAMKTDATFIYLMSWGFLTVAFFSISQSKLPGYILPALAPFSVFTAHALVKSLHTPNIPIPGGWTVLALTPLATVGAVILTSRTLRHPIVTQQFVIASTILTISGISACLILALRHRWEWTLISGLLSWVIFVQLANRLELPAADRLVSPRPAVNAIRNDSAIAENVRTFRLTRSSRYALNFYLHRELKEWLPEITEPAIIFVSPAGVAELRRLQIHYRVFDDTCPNTLLVHIREGKNAGTEIASSASTADRHLR